MLRCARAVWGISDGLTLINNFMHADAHWYRISNKRIMPARSRVQRKNDRRDDCRGGRWLGTDFELKDRIPRDSLVNMSPATAALASVSRGSFSDDLAPFIVRRFNVLGAMNANKGIHFHLPPRALLSSPLEIAIELEITIKTGVSL